jgi:uncharacterized protein (TIGR02391 family)
MEIREIIPASEDLLKLEVEELAGVLLMHLNSGGGALHHHNFFNNIRQYPVYVDYNPERDERVNFALMEAWGWLAHEGFLAQRADDSGGKIFITRRGQRMKSREALAAYQRGNLLPKGQLHALIASKVYPAFLRGEYDTGIFQAFREVEIAVRAAGGFTINDHGTDLMRAAFRVPKNAGGAAGPLTDIALPAGEQEAMGHLFAGAFGVYRNSTGHRHVPTDPEEAAEVIMFASQLLRIVDRLSPTTGKP